MEPKKGVWPAEFPREVMTEESERVLLVKYRPGLMMEEKDEIIIRAVKGALWSCGAAKSDVKRLPKG